VIFGERASDVNKISLMVPPGCEGIVMDINFSSNVSNENEDVSTSDVRDFTKKAYEEFRVSWKNYKTI
jgi:DNA-directed RNA polymerase beta subunit